MRAQSAEPQDLASRVFKNRTFQAGWAVCLLLFAMVSWPIRNAFLVLWVYGIDGYFRKGIRVLPGKPIRFSDRSPAPVLQDMVTGFGIFFLTTLVLTLALIFALRFYERRSARRRSEGC
jgi:hypothetical protein